MEAILEELKKKIESGESVDFQALPQQLGFVLMRVAIHGNSIGSVKETKEHRALDVSEAEDVQRAGKLGTLEWAPCMAEGKCKTQFEGVDLEIAEKFNRIRKLGSRISELFRHLTPPYGSGEDGEHYRIVPIAALEEIKKEIAVLNQERQECADFCATHFDRLKEMQRPALEGRLRVEAKRAKLEDVEGHVKECIEKIYGNLPTRDGDAFRAAVGISYKERNFSTPDYLKNDPKAQAEYKEEWQSTCATAAEDTRKEFQAVIAGLLDNKTVQTDSIEKLKKTIRSFYTRNLFVNSAEMAKVVDDLRDYLAKRGCYPELDKNEDGSVKNNTEKKVAEALKLKVQVIRAKYLPEFRASLMAAQAGLDAEPVAKAIANPFASKGRVMI